jgi:hypothetical protein
MIKCFLLKLNNRNYKLYHFLIGYSKLKYKFNLTFFLFLKYKIDIFSFYSEIYDGAK